MMSLRGVSKKFGGIDALSNCNIEIKKGKITAIIGPNGSGKSTLFDVICRMIEKDGGRIDLDGVKIDKLEDFQIARFGISRTFQEARIFKNLSAREHLEIALSENDGRIFSSVFRKEVRRDLIINYLLRLVELDGCANLPASELSFGQRKLLDLVTAIAKPHKLIMLDEPVAGVNPRLRVRIKGILRELKKHKESVLVIEHDMDFVMNLADFVYVLDNGEVIACGSPREVRNNKKVLEVYLGKNY